MNTWDYALLIVVSLQATAVAYMAAPRTKALIMTLPLPFSMAFMALGRPVDATNVIGLALILLFMHAVRWMHVHAHVPIIAAISAAALLYGFAGGAIAHVIPRNTMTFWLSAAVIFIFAAVILRMQPYREEPHHKSPLPIYIKLPVIAAVITTLILSKNLLHGFMTVFPMVSIITAYEARHSLWTMTRQMPVIMITLGSMIIAMRLIQPHAPALAALACGWVVFGTTLWIFGRCREKVPSLPDAPVMSELAE